MGYRNHPVHGKYLLKTMIIQYTPSAGRIVAVADVYDALGCDRVYKKAWPESDLLKFFKAEKG